VRRTGGAATPVAARALEASISALAWPVGHALIALVENGSAFYLPLETLNRAIDFAMLDSRRGPTKSGQARANCLAFISGSGLGTRLGGVPPSPPARGGSPRATKRVGTRRATSPPDQVLVAGEAGEITAYEVPAGNFQFAVRSNQGARKRYHVQILLRVDGGAERGGGERPRGQGGDLDPKTRVLDKLDADFAKRDALLVCAWQRGVGGIVAAFGGASGCCYCLRCG
jgi:hypothetical protein